MAEVKVDGLEIQLGKLNYILPPIPVIRMTKIGYLFEAGSDDQEQYIETLIKAVHWSLLRNYPEMEYSFVENNIDTVNMPSIMKAFLEVNMLQRTDGQVSGEIMAR